MRLLQPTALLPTGPCHFNFPYEKSTLRCCLSSCEILHGSSMENFFLGNFTWAKNHMKTSRRPVVFPDNSVEYSTWNSMSM